MGVENFDQQDRMEEEAQLQNKENFEKNLGFDTLSADEQKIFEDMVKGVEYDENKDPEENMQKAFEENVGKMIEKNTANLPPEQRAEISVLMQDASKKGDLKELLETFKQATDVVDTKNGWDAQGTAINQRMDQSSQEQDRLKNKESQDFLQKFQEWVKKDAELYQERQKNNIQQREQNNVKNNAECASEREQLTASLNAPSSRTTSGNTGGSV